MEISLNSFNVWDLFKETIVMKVIDVGYVIKTSILIGRNVTEMSSFL